MAEKPGCISVNGQGIEQSGSSKQSMVRCRDDASHKHSIDKTACDGTASLLEDESEGTGGRVSVRQTRIVVWYVEANNNDRHNVE